MSAITRLPSTPSENTSSLMFRDMRSEEDIRYFDINSSYNSQMPAKHDDGQRYTGFKAGKGRAGELHPRIFLISSA